MEKYHNLISLLVGLLFLIVLQKFSTPQPVFRFLLPAFVLYVLLTLGYNRWYLKSLEKYNVWTTLRFALLQLAGAGIFFFIPSYGLRGLFMVCAVALITLFEYFIAHFAEDLILNQTLLIAFGFFFSASATAWEFPAYSFAATLLVFLIVSLLARAFYESVPQSARIKTAIALVLGLLCSELFWSLTFLPPYFYVLALILFNVFYLCLILNYYYLFHILTFKKAQFHLALMAACTILVLLTAHWSIIL